MIFPISKAKYKIIKSIYENPNIRISELLKINKISQKSGYLYINELLDAHIISQKIDKPLRLLKPDFNEAGKMVFSLVEEEKKLHFFERHKELKGPFFQFEKETSNFITCALIFGSFSRSSENKESDVDIMIITENQENKKIEKAVEKCFITLKNKPSIRLVTKDNFIDSLEKEDEFAKQILKDYIIIINSSGWINLISKSKK